jgi:PAS domain S-box-containing protein
MQGNIKLHRITTVAAGLTAGLGLLGAALGTEPLPGGSWDRLSMSVVTGLGFGLSGGALLLLHLGRRPLVRRLGLGLAVLLFGLTLADLGGHPWPDWFGRHAAATWPVRTPLNPAVPFVMTGLALIALYLPRRSWFNVANWLGLAVAEFALLTLVGYLLRPDAAFDHVSLPGIACFLLLGVGLVCAQVEVRLVRLFAPGHPLGFLALRLVLVGLIVPLVLYALQVIWLLPLVPHAHDFIALTAVFLSLAVLGAFIFSLWRMDEFDRLRREAENSRDNLFAQLQQQASGLELQVAERTRSLNESTQRLQLALRASRYGVWDLDVTAGTILWDDRQLALHGLQAGDFDGRLATWLEFLHPEDRPFLQKLDQQMDSGSNALDYTCRLLRPDGSVRHIEAHCIVERDERGRAVRIVGLNRDITTEHEHESTVSALNQRLQFVLNSSGYGVWEFDYARLARFWDDQLLRIYGLARADLRGGQQDWEDRIHPEDRPAVQTTLAELRGSRRHQFTQQFRIVRPDGAVRHIETRAYLLRESDGRERLVGFDSDVTEAHELREALRITEERWKLALSSNHDAVWDQNFTTGEIYRDERYVTMLGYAAGELEGTTPVWRQIGHPDDLPAVETAIADHLAGRAPVFESEYRLRHKDGCWIWILGRGKVVARDTQGRALRMVGTQTDVTARKQLEVKLRHGEEMSLQLGRLAQIGAWEWDLETGRLTWSPEMFGIHEVELGYEPSPAKSLGFFPPVAEATLAEALNQCAQAGAGFDLELPFRTAREHERFVRVLGRAEVKGGKTMRIYGAFQDITGRRDAEETRRTLERQLFQAQKMETLGTLAGGIAHDFNNLLAGILGYQELALETLAPEDPARTCVTAARDASLRARELIEQILTFSRQAGSEKAPVNLTRVVEDARRFLRATVPSTISIEVFHPADCGPVLADASQIHQVLLNLGSNAAHAMRLGGGTIRLNLAAVEFDAAAAAGLGKIAAGRYVRLEFSDTGHGMDEETRKRIFDPFFTTKEVGQGTGLGLSVVHGIIEAHRGAITVDSAPGQGATFTLYLPVAEAEQPEPAEVETARPRGTGELIAVVDDDAMVGSIAKLALEKAGYKVMMFDSPLDCLERLRQRPEGLALLLTDQTMPVMTGIELAAEVRTFAPDLPVLIMSGYFSWLSPQKLAEIGRIALLPKPYTNEELVRAIARALRPEAGA